MSKKRGPAQIGSVILCIATPDYLKKWRRCVNSQRRYAGRCGVLYKLVEVREKSGVKWVKFEEALKEISAGSHVLLLDADAEVRDITPPFDEIMAGCPDKDIFCVLGQSGRANSGVVMLRAGRDSAGARLLSLCLENRGRAVKQENFVTVEGENGHFIEYMQDPMVSARVELLDMRWNNTIRPAEQDYIRHYTVSMRDYYYGGAIRQVMASKRWLRRMNGRFWKSPPGQRLLSVLKPSR